MAIAMGLLVVVALIVGTASATFYNSYRRSVKTTERLKSYQAIDRVMDGNLRNLIPFKWVDDDASESRYVFEGEADSLHFTALRRTYGNDRGAFLFIRLKVENDELVAEYSSYPRLPWLEEGKQEYNREVLAKNVRSVRFLYYDMVDDEIEEEETWDEDDHDNLPLAIQMTVEWADGTSEQWLRRTAGSSSNSTLGVRTETEE
jgi:Pseudopilin GspJ.